MRLLPLLLCSVSEGGVGSLVILCSLNRVLSCGCLLCSIKVTEVPTQCFINFNQVTGCTVASWQTVKVCKLAFHCCRLDHANQAQKVPRLFCCCPYVF